MTLAETVRRGYGYTTAVIPPSSDGARCEGPPSCTRPAARLVKYYAGGDLRAEKLFRKGHAPDRGHAYRPKVDSSE